MALGVCELLWPKIIWDDEDCVGVCDNKSTVNVMLRFLEVTGHTILMSEAPGPRRRLLFLGERSFEIEEEGVDRDREKSIRIVEKGSGLRCAVVLVGKEIQWLAALFHRFER